MHVLHKEIMVGVLTKTRCVPVLDIAVACSMTSVWILGTTRCTMAVRHRGAIACSPSPTTSAAQFIPSISRPIAVAFFNAEMSLPN
jgi:hypothetical protein